MVNKAISVKLRLLSDKYSCKRCHSAKPIQSKQISAVFLIGYGCLRFLGEFAREPDNFLGFLAAGLTMGQWLSAPMVVIGIFMFIACAKPSGHKN